MSTVKKTTGLAIASAAAALLLSGCNSNPSMDKMDKMSKMDKKEAAVHCSGVNACKGHGACATAGHDCKGKNACKGKGWVPMSKDECMAKGGKVAG